jgi:hypothetical protein
MSQQTFLTEGPGARYALVWKRSDDNSFIKYSVSTEYTHKCELCGEINRI